MGTVIVQCTREVEVGGGSTSVSLPVLHAITMSYMPLNGVAWVTCRQMAVANFEQRV